MDRLVLAGLMNGVLASLLALVVVAATRTWRNPYFGRIAWLAVLLKLVTPPLLFVPVEVAWLAPVQEPVPAAAIDFVAHPAGAAAERPAVAVGVDGHVAGGLPQAEVAPPAIEIADEPGAVARSLESLILQLRSLDWLRTWGVVWIAGSLLLGVLATMRIWQFQRLLSRSQFASPTVADRAAAIAARLGLRRTPQVVVAGRMAPLAWSLGRQATVILPAALVESLDDDALDAVLAHELTHLRRRDNWARWLELAATTIYWWCPTAWFARRCVHEAEEQCCDADVLRMFPALRQGYGRALLETLDLLAGEWLTAPGASGWGSHRSLRRRFEQIAEDTTAPQLAPWWQRLAWGIAIAMCLTTPMAANESGDSPSLNASLATADAPPEDEIESKPCTITLEDGSVINGTLIDAEADRMIVVRTPQDAASKADATGASESSTPRPVPKGSYRHRPNEENPRPEWELSLEECVYFSFHFRPGYRILFESGGKEPATLWSSDDNRQSLTIVQEEAERIARQTAEDYWKLSFCFGRLAARNEAQQSALEIWRRVKARHRVGAEGGSAMEEAQTRAHYHLCREQVSQAVVELHAAEAKLRSAINLSTGDRRLIRPTSVPLDRIAPVDLKLLLKVAFAKRIELKEQAKRWQEQQKLQQEALAAAGAPGLSALEKQRMETKAQHHELLARREATVLEDMKLSIVEGLTSEVRDLQLKKDILATNDNRRHAAQDEVAAVTATYEVGRVTLDLMLQSCQRAVDAENAFQQSLVDHTIAALKVEDGKGTLLESMRIRVAE